jgi:hypothetical protein
MRFKGFILFIFFLMFFVTHAEAGNITLRVVAVNPSDENAQTVPIKVYLPVEIKPEDIIYKEDLGVAYDTQQGSYYVFGEYEIKPKEVLEKEIEIKDIWIIEDSRIVGLHKEAKDVFSAFEKTDFAQKAALLYKGIEKKLNEIEEMQKISANSPTQHISDYRYCLGLLNSAENDLVTAKTLLAEITPRGFAKITWKLIVFIIVFLGILGLGFYIIWQRQAKLTAEEKHPQD